MVKGVVFGLLLLIMGVALWWMAAGEISNPAEEVAVRMGKETFAWFTCPNCSKLFMAEESSKKGECPYCGFAMILGAEQKRTFGVSVDNSQYGWFLSPACKKVFFAYETKQAGKCPYCGEAVDLTLPESIGPQESPPALLVSAKTHAGPLLLIGVVFLAISVAGIHFLLENRVILSLEPIEGALPEEQEIRLSRRQAKRKQLTLGPSATDDINIDHPSLKDAQYTLSFVRVGRNTHAYLSRSPNKPVLINDKPRYNAQLKDSDKVRLGDIVFEVHANKK